MSGFAWRLCRARRRLSIAWLVCVLLSGPASSSVAGLRWVPLATAPGYQDLSGQPATRTIVADGRGGYLLAWQDGGAQGGNIVVQGLTADLSPNPSWPQGGWRFSSEFWVVLGGVAPDGRGGALAWWTRDGGRVTIRQLGADGSAQSVWPPKGVTFGSATGPVEIAAVEADGSGGAWVVFSRPGTVGASELRVTWIQSNGAFGPAYGEAGRMLTDRASGHPVPLVAPDGQGGALVCWMAVNPGGAAELRLLRLTTTGDAPGWPAEGVVVRATPELMAESGDGISRITADGSGGAYVAWVEWVAGSVTVDRDVLLSHLTGDGRLAGGWPLEGVKLAGTERQEEPSDLFGDGQGGVFLVWHVGWVDVRVQRVRADGTLAAGAWREGGVSPVPSGTGGAPAVAAPDGEGGLYVTWEKRYATGEMDDRVGTLELQRLTAAGEPAVGWPAEGQLLLRLQNRVIRRGIATGGPDQLVLVWSEYSLPGTNAESDIFGLQVSAEPPPPPPPQSRRLSFGRPLPNPTAGPMTVELELPASTPIKVWIADLAGRSVRALVDATRGPGIERIVWDGRDQAGHPVGQGVFFVVREAMGRRRADPFVVAR